MALQSGTTETWSRLVRGSPRFVRVIGGGCGACGTGLRLSSTPHGLSSAPLLPMIYSLSLETALLLVGLAMIAFHGFALLAPSPTQSWLKSFPRSAFWGTILLIAAAAWFYWLIMTMDLHEFSNWRKVLRIGTPIAALLTWHFVPEFLAVRSLGMLVLLGAEALLESAWMRPEGSRLWLVSLVYVWLTAGLFWVGMPYTLRDQIAWVTANRRRWNVAAAIGVGYGAILLISRLTLHR